MSVRRYIGSWFNWLGWRIDEARTSSIELNLGDMYQAIESAKVRTLEFSQKNSQILGQINIL